VNPEIGSVAAISKKFQVARGHTGGVSVTSDRDVQAIPGWNSTKVTIMQRAQGMTVIPIIPARL
jgi:hypothetical protein